MPHKALGPEVAARTDAWRGRGGLLRQARASQQGGEARRNRCWPVNAWLRAQRQGGHGRGDAARLSTRGTLRRVLARPEGSARAGSLRRHRVGGSPQGREPQDRMQGATNLRAWTRRKPWRWWETTCTERDASGGTDAPNTAGNGSVEWTRPGQTVEGRFETNPKRGGDPPGSPACVRLAEGEPKDREACGRSLAIARQGAERSSRSPSATAKLAEGAGKANDPHPPLARLHRPSLGMGPVLPSGGPAR